MVPIESLAQPLTPVAAQSKRGTLYGIGVGPGDPELITLKALRLLRSAEVIAYQSAENHRSVARSIVADFLPGHQTEITYHLPRALDAVAAQPLYDALVDPIVVHLDAGRDVVVLCEGDPLFYGSFMYVYTRLVETYRTEVVPGICSPMGCAAAVGIPMSYRNDVFSILPAPLPAAELAHHLRQADAAAIIKLRRHFPKVRSVLEELGLMERACYIERGTRADQRIIPLAEVDPEQVPYFAMILVPSQQRL